MGSSNNSDSTWHRHPLVVGIVAPCVAGGLLWQFGLGGGATPTQEEVRSTSPADPDRKVLSSPSAETAAVPSSASSAPLPSASSIAEVTEREAGSPSADQTVAQAKVAESARTGPLAPAIGIIEHICRSGRITIDLDFDRQGMMIPDPGGARTIRVRNCDAAGGTFETAPEGSGGTSGGRGHATPYTLAFDFFLYDPQHSSPMRCAISARDIVGRAFDGKVKCTYTYRKIPTYDVAVAI
ncbi:MAG: hypothetical protein ACK4GG_05445 [Sphingomonas sp.]